MGRYDDRTAHVGERLLEVSMISDGSVFSNDEWSPVKDRIPYQADSTAIELDLSGVEMSGSDAPVPYASH